MNTLVSYEIAEHVATITYNRPDTLNAINAEMRQSLNDAFSRFRDDEDAWVAIVTGAGRAFCAGGRHARGREATGEFAGTFWEKPTVNSFESGWEIYKPVIAAVNGYLPGLRSHPGDLVRLRDRQRSGRVRLSRGAPRRAHHRRRDPAAPEDELAVRHGDAPDR